MAKSLAEAIVIVLDIGQNVGHKETTNRKTFLKNAQLCAINIIQRKIIARSKDELSLILLGSEETRNPLADGEGNYNNIQIAHTLQTANWRMVHTISNYDKCTKSVGDWLDALVVAADYLKRATEGKRYSEKKIVLLTNFCSDVSDEEIDCVIQGLRNEEVQVVVIGPQVYVSESQGHNGSQDIKSEEQREGEKLISRIVHEVENSVICGFEDAIPQLMYFGQRKIRPTPWQAVMDIGSSIRIPVIGYKKVSDVQKPPMLNIVMSYNNARKQTMSANSNEGAASQVLPSSEKVIEEAQPVNEDIQEGQMDAEMDDNRDFGLIDKDRIFQTVGEDAVPVDVNDVIEGYMFGTTVVSVTDDDRPSLAYDSGPKCLSVLGFTKKQNVPVHLLKGKGCYQFFSQNEEHCMQAFSALIQAMDIKDVVAIVRKVYRCNACPTMCALFPMITPDFQCFVCIELPYAEEVKTMLFPPLVTESNKPSDAQLRSVDQLINSMDLMAIDDNEEAETGAYDPHKTLNPYEQHFHSVVAKKALNNDLTFSGLEIDKAVQLLLTPNKILVESAKPAVGRIKELFPLIEIVPKEGARKAAADIFKQDAFHDTSTSSTVQQASKINDVVPYVGTINPQEDFVNLVDQGVSLEKVCSLMAQVISSLVLKAFDVDDLSKPLKCLLFMRTVCIKKNPQVFNDWITKYKDNLPHEKIGFWQLVVNEKAGLITKTESGLSLVSEDEAGQFLLVADVKDNTLPPQSVDEDLDDLINQM